MAEVLTQSQIDALLNSVANGGFEEEKKEETPEKKYRKYDFYSPKKFTKDKLKMLNNIYENYARLLNARINGLLRMSSEVEVINVEEQRFYEFSNALGENDVLTLIDVHLPNDAEEMDEIPTIVHINTEVMLLMIDRMLGGSGEEEPNVSLEYKYTDLELALYQDIIERFIRMMKDGWINYLDDVGFSIQKIERASNMMQTIGMDETIVIIVLNIKIGKITGQMNVCIPGTHLSVAFDLIDSRNSNVNRGKGSIEDTAEEIMECIRSSTLEIKAELGQAQVNLNDIYNLHVGDVINLNKPKDSEIYLYIEEQPWFKGKLGVQNKNMAVKISGVYEE
ncbi:MAG TPA: flagellar motor switch protein FliM [Candidatus Coprocola pullicola]|nr:flagellar motor switch protein FliM [Candidatus Coprocola pullicola]